MHTVLGAAAFLPGVFSHGALISPRPRNAVDAYVGVNAQACSNLTGDACHNGQAAFWYSQGCFIGCDECDEASGRRQVDLCGKGKKQTLTDPKYWSVNRDATPFSANDIYQHNPWRAPGSAPVSDACGLAGGSHSRQSGPEAGDYKQTKYARHGDVGTEVLKPLPGYTPPTYKLGGTIEATWAMRNNHGGGYSYRLCPLPEGNFTGLTEACFQDHHLEFVEEEQSILFPNGTLLKLEASQRTFVRDGTYPPGSTWSLIPMPPTLLGPCCLPGPADNATTPNKCLPGDNHVGQCSTSVPAATNCAPCPGTPGSDCSRCDQVSVIKPDRYKLAPQFPEPCPGFSGVDWHGGYSVRDVLKIPANLEAGQYILGFRYDCEATAQVWSSCADITLE
jgi:hypothetical protein